MIPTTNTTTAARFMFVHDDEIIFCTSDLNHYKKVISPNDISQIATGDPIDIYDKQYNIDNIGIEHYSWPLEGHVLNQVGELYPYSINITVSLSSLNDEEDV